MNSRANSESSDVIRDNLCKARTVTSMQFSEADDELFGINYLSKHYRLNVGRIALERLVGALINCSLLQSRGGGGGRTEGGREGGSGSLNGTKKFNSGLQITTLEVNIYTTIKI